MWHMPPHGSRLQRDGDLWALQQPDKVLGGASEASVPHPTCFPQQQFGRLPENSVALVMDRSY